MAKKKPFTISYDDCVIDHLHCIEKKYHRLIANEILAQLEFEPESPTRNRKPLRQPAPFDATWELRLGPDNRFRVFYALDPEKQLVQIQAIGLKKGNRLIVGEEEIDL